jgi:hypothetical protein
MYEQKRDGLSEGDHERLARLNRERLERDRAPHIPPEHIVSGECTFEALNTYLTLHPFNTFRAREAARMYEWMYPIVKAHQASGGAWGLLDIIGDDPGSKQEYGEDDTEGEENA